MDTPHKDAVKMMDWWIENHGLTYVLIGLELVCDERAKLNPGTIGASEWQRMSKKFHKFAKDLPSFID